ncbi:hypothetical protein ACOMHN_006512 [Nucella lapillus]
MRKDPSFIFSTILQGDVGEYLASGINTPATHTNNSRSHWGTDIEIAAFATLCKCTVLVWKDQDANVPEYWVPYEPLQPPNMRKTRRKKTESTGITCLLHAPFDHLTVVLDP